ETPSRRKIFTCHPPFDRRRAAPGRGEGPATEVQERACATDILRRLATQAYRSPVRDDLNDLLAFYAQARADGGDFEEGIRFGIPGILANPRFMFRVEATPPERASGSGAYRLTDLDLASRLSFFLWGTLPDQELLKVAGDGTLSSPAVLDRQVR